jgi:transcription elongation GreA/GreB family factor
VFAEPTKDSLETTVEHEEEYPADPGEQITKTVQTGCLVTLVFTEGNIGKDGRYYLLGLGEEKENLPRENNVIVISENTKLAIAISGKTVGDSFTYTAGKEFEPKTVRGTITDVADDESQTIH